MSPYEENHGFKLYDAEFLVTEPAPGDEQIETQWGRMSYKNWLNCESQRWTEKNFRQSWIRQNPEGLVALVSLKEYQSPVRGKE